MPCLFRQLLEILRLRSTVSFAKRMNVVDVADDDSRFPCEFVRGQTLEKSGAREPAVNIRHPGLNVLPELKLTSALRNFDGTKLSGPVVDILEQVSMDGAEIHEVE
jgi:hypothetical protein